MVGVPNILPEKLRPFAKALYPFLATLAGVAVHGVFTGEWNTAETEAAALGIALSLLAFLVPNGAARHELEGEPEEGETTTLGTPTGDFE